MSAVKQKNSFSSDRIAAGLSLADIERELGVSTLDVQSWETGATQPPNHVTNALSMIGQCRPETSPPLAEVNKPEGGLKTDKPQDANADSNSTDNDSLIKSRKRVADHGEVFTPPWLVEKMLDLVKGETERIDSRFLEPACGSGNFLVPILQRKMAAVEVKYGKSDFEKKHFALLALTSLYGVELLADNIAECRANMLNVYADYLGIEPEDDAYRAASHVLSLNLIHGDAMTMKTADGNPITVAEWGYLGKGKFNRRDFRLDVLTGMSQFKEEQSLFSHLGRHEIFQPAKDYPPLRMRELAALDISVQNGSVA